MQVSPSKQLLPPRNWECCVGLAHCGEGDAPLHLWATPAPPSIGHHTGLCSYGTGASGKDSNRYRRYDRPGKGIPFPSIPHHDEVNTWILVCVNDRPHPYARPEHGMDVHACKVASICQRNGAQDFLFAATTGEIPVRKWYTAVFLC